MILDDEDDTPRPNDIGGFCGFTPIPWTDAERREIARKERPGFLVGVLPTDKPTPKRKRK